MRENITPLLWVEHQLADNQFIRFFAVLEDTIEFLFKADVLVACAMSHPLVELFRRPQQIAIFRQNW